MTKSTGVKTRLSHNQYLKLADKVRLDYVSSKLSNDAYALKASADLEFPVSPHSVADVLRVLEMPSNLPVVRKGTAINLSAEARLKIDLLWETVGNMRPEMVEQFKRATNDQ